MRLMVPVLIVAAVVAVSGRAPSAQAPDAQTVAGAWELNSWLTDSSDQIVQAIKTDLRTNDLDLFTPPAAPEEGERGRGGRRNPIQPQRQSHERALLKPDEQQKIQSLLDIARLPAVSLTIAQDGGKVTITDPVRGSRTFQANGVKEPQKFESGVLDATTRWEGPQLITDYDVGHGNALRFSYMIVPPSNVLLIRISVQLPGNAAAPFVIKHVYDKGTAAKH